MISCYELRIGNYVLVDARPGLISAITNTSVSTIEKDDQLQEASKHGFEHIEPAPLTDELLKQCGFVYHDYFKIWQLIPGIEGKRSELDIDRDYDVVDFMRRPIIKNVTSLHQLQNIYFMLKGRELNVEAKAVAVN